MEILIITFVAFLLFAAGLSLTVVFGNRKSECNCKQAARIIRDLRNQRRKEREEFYAKICAGCPAASKGCNPAVSAGGSKHQ